MSSCRHLNQKRALLWSPRRIILKLNGDYFISQYPWIVDLYYRKIIHIIHRFFNQSYIFSLIEWCIVIFTIIILKAIIMEDPIADFIHWYKTRPIITKSFLTLSTLLSVLVTMNVFSVYEVYYTFSQVYATFEIWRPLTSLLFLGNLNFTFILQAYFAYHALVSAEEGIFQREYIANFWYLLMYLFTMMTIAASIIDLYFISDGFLFALIYIWCKIKPFNRVNLLLGLNMESGYFPWVYLGVTVLLGQSFINMVIGFLIAHLYLYVKGTLQSKIGVDLLKTPSILHSLARLYNRRLIREEADEQQRQNNENQMHEDDMYQ